MKAIIVMFLGLCALAAAYPAIRDDEVSEMKKLLQEMVERKNDDDHKHHDELEKAEKKFLEAFEDIIHEYLVERGLIDEKDDGKGGEGGDKGKDGKGGKGGDKGKGGKGGKGGEGGDKGKGGKGGEKPKRWFENGY